MCKALRLKDEKMAEIKQLYGTPPQEDGGMKEYKKKLLRHRAGLGAKILICAGLVLAAGLVIFLWISRRTYTDYEVVASVEHVSTLDTQYEEYDGKLLKYSKDGISCLDASGEALWSQTWSMQTPMLAVCGKAAAVADKQGSEVYVFGSDGLQTQITTLLPIEQISVSSQGVTALLLTDNDVSWIYLYDKEGNKLAESRCTLDETGQPLAIAISSDGAKLAVSYLQIQEGTAASCLVFYNFGSVGSNFVDKIVASSVYADTIIPAVQYLGSSVCAAVSDQGIIYYEGAEIPEEKATVTLSSEIRSVFFGESAVGIVTDGDAEEAEVSEAAETETAASEDAEDTEAAASSAEETSGSAGITQSAAEESSKYLVSLYGTDGQCFLAQGTDLEYTLVKYADGNLILCSENEAEIYSKQGVLRYAGSFDGTIYSLYRGSGLRKYIVVFSDRTDTIRLK